MLLRSAIEVACVLGDNNGRLRNAERLPSVCDRDFDMQELLCSPSEMSEYNQQIGTVVLPPPEDK